MTRSSPPLTIEGLSSIARQPWVLLTLGWLAASAVLAGVAGEAARRDATGELERQATAGAALHAAVLRSELDKQRAIPIVLAGDPDVAALLTTPSALRWRRKNGQSAKVGSTSMKDGLYDWQTEAVFG